MSNRTLLALGVALCCGTVDARATDLDLYLASEPALDRIVVCAGAVVPYQVYGSLSVGSDEGLAGFAFDLEYDGGNLSQATPDTLMGSFISPHGFTNSEGFGGKTDVPGREGDLVQVGGAQNTINNDSGYAPYPTGVVTTGIAWLATELARGSVTAPESPGEYTLSIPAGSFHANVIKAGETGDPFWATEAAGLGASSHLSLTITVVEECRPVVSNLEVFYAGRFETCVEGTANGEHCFDSAACPGGFCELSAPAADPSPTFLAPGSTATLDNITNYIHGITGIRVFFSQLVEFVTSPEAAFSFEWTPEDGTTFSPVGDVGSAVSVNPKVQDGKTVIKIIFADDHVRKRWLKVTVDSTQVIASGVELDGELFGSPAVLPGGDGTPGGDAVFFLGNMPGDVTGDRKTTLTDVGQVRLQVSPALLVPIDNVYDVDKSGKVQLEDVGAVREDVNPAFALPLISP